MRNHTLQVAALNACLLRPPQQPELIHDPNCLLHAMFINCHLRSNEGQLHPYKSNDRLDSYTQDHLCGYEEELGLTRHQGRQSLLYHPCPQVLEAAHTAPAAHSQVAAAAALRSATIETCNASQEEPGMQE